MTIDQYWQLFSQWQASGGGFSMPLMSDIDTPVEPTPVEPTPVEPTPVESIKKSKKLPDTE
jgi:hypothetical protein